MSEAISVSEAKPPFEYSEKDQEAKIVLLIPELKCRTLSSEPKNAMIINRKLSDTSIEIVIQINTDENSGGQLKHYAFRIKRLPGKIDPRKSSIRCTNRKIKIKLHKVVNEPWVAYADRDYDIG